MYCRRLDLCLMTFCKVPHRIVHHDVRATCSTPIAQLLAAGIKWELWTHKNIPWNLHGVNGWEAVEKDTIHNQAHLVGVSFCKVPHPNDQRSAKLVHVLVHYILKEFYNFITSEIYTNVLCLEYIGPPKYCQMQTWLSTFCIAQCVSVKDCTRVNLAALLQ